MKFLRSVIHFNAHHPQQSGFNYHWFALLATMACMSFVGGGLFVGHGVTPLRLALFVLIAVLLFVAGELMAYWVHHNPSERKTLLTLGYTCILVVVVNCVLNVLIALDVFAS
ncbi:beta/alpha barrel domain-containing protein [Bifidobacterium choloepi]|uniref:Uncharacterized protein n=1 Tax=Bifidobacterium choloepi TaxID=2614131 RepID=A0A6I5N1X0_9BIFI|nr:hypothetical protein [Bifidobacterium choloepi]NEG69629.1 hypothetical protein [Bifidobacterium choloepi]